MSNEMLQYINRTPVTFGVLGIYVLMAFLTDIMWPSGEQLIDWGGAMGILIQDGQVWRLVTHCFLHGAWFHLALNGYALFILGPYMEHRLGSVKFAILYLMAGIAGGLAALLVQEPHLLLIGGSGSIFGLLGAILASNMRSGRHPLDVFNHPATRLVLILLAINLVLGFAVNLLSWGISISNSAHIGGLIGGFVVTYCFLDRGRFRPDKVSRTIQAAWLALGLSLTFYVMFPVLRWDYHVKMSLLASDRAVRSAHEEIADRQLRHFGGYTAAIHVLKDAAHMPAWGETIERWEQGR